MDWLLYVVALGLVKSLQSLPLHWVVRLGRAGGGLAYWLDARHRRVARARVRDGTASADLDDPPTFELRKDRGQAVVVVLRPTI